MFEILFLSVADVWLFLLLLLLLFQYGKWQGVSVALYTLSTFFLVFVGIYSFSFTFLSCCTGILNSLRVQTFA